MSATKLTPAILIVSRTASKDPSTDRSGTVLAEVFESAGEHDGEWDPPQTRIVDDDLREIQTAVQAWTDTTDDAVNLIVTSGGTGFAVGDVTPEAITPLLHRHAPGLVHGMLAASLKVTPFAIMSRPVAGVRHRTLIVTLPGSPKGARENLEAIVKLLPHACRQAAGGDSRQMHVGGVQRLEREAGLSRQEQMVGTSSTPMSGDSQPHQHDHSHHQHGHDHHAGHGHGHHHAPRAHTKQTAESQTNDPALGPTRRHRSSPYPMLTVREALEQIRIHTPPAKIISQAVNLDLVDCVLAEDVKAAEAVPAFRASIVDGYAVHIPQGSSTNAAGTFPVAFVSHAHGGDVPELQPGTISRITTGAPLPPGSSAVVMVEDTVLKSKTEDGHEEAEVELLTGEVKPGENVREIGSDVRKGDIVMRKGEGVTSMGGEFGLLASVGTKEVRVFQKPRVGILSTGDEIVPHDRPNALALGEVRDTNRPTLLAAIRAQGFEAVDLGIASDKPGSLEASLRRGLEQVEVLMTSGGVSMGELDLLKPTIERALGGTIHFGRVSMKPGKPTTFATVPTSTGDKVIFSLPGNPASAVVTFMLFVLPSLHQASGITPAGLPRVAVRLETAVRCDAAREEYHRVVVCFRSGSGQEGLWASSTGGQRSSRIGSFKSANALLKLPAGGGTLERGARVEALLMGPPIGLLSAA